MVLAPKPRQFVKRNSLSGDEHKDLFNFVRHLKAFTGLAEIASSKDLGENPQVTIARVQKAGSGVEHDAGYRKLFRIQRNSGAGRLSIP